MGNHSLQSGPRFLNGRHGSEIGAQLASSQRSQPAVFRESGDPRQLKSTETTRAQRDSDFLWCARCRHRRPSDPFAQFCAQCGAALPLLPGHRLPPAEGGQVLHALTCKSIGHVMCVCCGSGNPADAFSCLTCESRLQQVSSFRSSVPSDPGAHTRMLSCTRCKRLNRSDARFCDWCGSKVNAHLTPTPAHAARCVTCRRCGASAHPYASYCTACGIFLEAPVPLGSLQTACGATWRATASLRPPRSVKIATPTVDQCTQTVGLYYPSGTELQRKEQHRALQLLRKQVQSDRHPPLTAISPGRGYWRKQLDHVCAHLRSYAQNNAPFRALLGEPRLGRVNRTSHVVLHEPVQAGHFLWCFLADGLCGDSGGSPRGQSDRQLCSSRVKDVQLLMELGPGRGEVGVIQQLLDQGADPSCCRSDGLHALAVAVVNGHRDVLPVLVQRGADVDQQSGRMKNTALHEAAALGSAGVPCAEVLLSCKANVRRRNAAGQTAYDVAASSGCGSMASLLAAQTGLDLLGKLGIMN
uniref:Double zinc ribbon and ankyrin repeat domains 1 n=1 Tax=Neolamprologus brichardi TaxID=32507 RepID=A0A3Q4HTN0_NEOBR